MSSENSSLLQSFVKYGDSGSMTHLETLRTHLDAHNETSKTVKIHLPTAAKVSRNLIRVIEENEDKIRSAQAWNVLTFMCDHKRNTSAYDLLKKLQQADVLSWVAQALSMLTLDESDLEAEACLSSLIMFTRADENRQIMVAESTSIIDTLVAMMDTKFSNTTDTLKIALCNALANILGRNVVNRSSRTTTDVFVTGDGFRVVNSVLDHLAQWAKDILLVRPFTTEEVMVLQSFLVVLNSVYISLKNVCYRHGVVMDKDKYMFNIVTLSHNTATLYAYFSLSDDPAFKDSVFSVFISYFEYVHLLMPEALKTTLMYNGDASMPAAQRVPWIVQFFRCASDAEISKLRGALQTGMEVAMRYSEMFPTVSVLIYEEMQGGMNDYVF